MPLYLYCIIPYMENFSFSHESKKIYLIPFREMAAVVSDCEEMEKELNEDAIREHEKIVREVMEKHIVVPVAFGMTFKNEQVLLGIIEKSYEVLKESIAKLQDRIELGVKVISKNTEETEENLSVKEDIENSLLSKSVEMVKGRIFSERLLVNSSFLIEKNRIEEFSAEVSRFEQKYPRFKFQYSGPWPPYSFANIKISQR